MTVAELIDVLAAMAGDPGEADGLTELDHGLQCAVELERVRPGDARLQVAGLVHDVGHRLGPDDAHGQLGGEYVRDLLGDRIAELVEAHVPAKRYLVATDPSYREALSAISVVSLAEQGGPLSDAEVAAFAARPCAADAVELRRADDRAKVPGRSVPGLDHWIPLLRQVAS